MRKWVIVVLTAILVMASVPAAIAPDENNGGGSGTVGEEDDGGGTYLAWVTRSRPAHSNRNPSRLTDVPTTYSRTFRVSTTTTRS